MTQRAADKIREELEQAITTGIYADGARLDEVTLTLQFQVSRTPVREALQMLAASGLVELIPRRGAFVRHPGFLELVEMFEVMAALESMCGRLAARRITQQELINLVEAAEHCKIALDRGNHDGYYLANEHFHQIIYDASGNGFLAKEAMRLQKRLQPYRRMQLRVRGRMDQSMDEHHQILVALESGNDQMASATLHDHVAIQGEKFHDLMAGYQKQPLSQTG